MLKYLLPILFVALISCDGSRMGCDVEEVEIVVEGNQVTAFASVHANQEILQYNWRFSDGFSEASIEPWVEHQVIQDGEYTVQLDVELNNGNTCTFESPFNINVNNVITDTCDIDIVHWELDGNELEVEVEIEGEVSDAGFCWDFGDGTTEYNQDNANDHIYNSKNTYIVKVGYEALNGCSDSTTKVINIDSLIHTVELCDIAFKGVPMINGKTVSIEVKTGGPLAGVEYHWDMGDSKPELVTTNPNYIYSYSQSGKYEIEVTMKKGTCEVSESITIYIQ